VWVSELIWILWSAEKSLTPARNQILAVKLIAIPTEISQLIQYKKSKKVKLSLCLTN
jgi:hypothetical protein